MTHDMNDFIGKLQGIKEAGLKSCQKCHTLFESRYYQQRFCQPTCRTIYNNRRASGRFPADPEPIDINLDDLA
jgi:hypothetical protein